MCYHCFIRNLFLRYEFRLLRVSHIHHMVFMNSNCFFYFWTIVLLKVCLPTTLFCINILVIIVILNFHFVLTLHFLTLTDFFCKPCSQGDVVGILLFSGLIDSFAYLNSKEPISQAVTDIKVTNNYLYLFYSWFYDETFVLLFKGILNS